MVRIMKLVIQIPCFNEENVLLRTLESLPSHIDGIDIIEILLIDDGSSDNTYKVAQQFGVQHILRFKRHQGLATAFRKGLNASLQVGADIILNTDADNQYRGEDIQKLVKPVLLGEADLVIGDRDVGNLEHFSPVKRRLQILGSHFVSQASDIKIPDATSGFRALSREAALQTIVLSDYSYTLETLIQAGDHKLSVAFVPVQVNPVQRPSRLMRGLSDYIVNSSVTITRSYSMYKPLRVFSMIGFIFLVGGIILGLRYLYFVANHSGAGHIQSVILSSVLLIVGFQIGLIGLLADLISANRKILEEILYHTRKTIFDSNNATVFEDQFMEKEYYEKDHEV